MFFFTSLMFFALLLSWIWVSIVLFRIYSNGVELVFNVRYKAMQKSKTAKLKKQYRNYLVMLWLIEILTGFATFTIGVLWLQSIF